MRWLAPLSLLAAAFGVATVVRVSRADTPIDANLGREVSLSAVRRLPLGVTRAVVERQLGRGGKPAERYNEPARAECFYYTRRAYTGEYLQVCYRRSRLVARRRVQQLPVDTGFFGID